MKKFPILLAGLACASAAYATDYTNVSMTFSSNGSYTSGSDYPDSPDGGALTSPDFFFNTVASTTWYLNNGSVTNLTGAAVNRVFVGRSNLNGTLNFDTGTAGNAGTIFFQNTNNFGFRINESGGSNTAIVNLNGGVTVESNRIWGGSATVANSQLNINNGRFVLTSYITGQALSALAVTLSQGSSLYLFDTGSTVTNASTFSTYAGGGSTLIAAGGATLQFTNGVSFTNAAGTAGTYTVITAVPEPSTYGLLGAGALAGMTLVRRRRRAA